MNTERIESLLQLRVEDPSDPFYVYALALEYASDSQHVERAVELLKELQISHPDYLPLYYQLGSLLKNTGKSDEALEIVRTGMNLALDQKNQHAFRELDFLRDDLE
jgi:tetratricopeptide (TPR) repeat protein